MARRRETGPDLGLDGTWPPAAGVVVSVDDLRSVLRGKCHLHEDARLHNVGRQARDRADDRALYRLSYRESRFDQV